MSQKKLEWLRRRFGEESVAYAITTVGIFIAEAFLFQGGHCLEA